MLVTCYYDIYQKPERFFEYLAHFYDLALSGIPIILFTDPSLIAKYRIFSHCTWLRIIGMPLTDGEIYSIAMKYTGPLPEHRTPEKDTKEFFGLMNMKVEFVKRAAEYTTDNTLIWIDYGILKIVKQTARFLEKLRRIHTLPYSKLTLPGCWAFGRPFHVDRIHWRFCGGLFIMPRHYIQRFYDHSYSVLRDFCTLPMYRLTWETNVWTVIESCAEKENIEWYFADHNDTILLHAPEP